MTPQEANLLRHAHTHDTCIAILKVLCDQFPSVKKDNNVCVTGEEWLVKKVSTYLPVANEKVVDMIW